MNQIYTQIIDTLISVGIPCLIGALFAAVKHFAGTQKVAQTLATLQTKSHLANEAVLFAEDASRKLGLARAKGQSHRQAERPRKHLHIEGNLTELYTSPICIIAIAIAVG